MLVYSQINLIPSVFSAKSLACRLKHCSYLPVQLCIYFSRNSKSRVFIRKFFSCYSFLCTYFFLLLSSFFSGLEIIGVEDLDVFLSLKTPVLNDVHIMQRIIEAAILCRQMACIEEYESPLQGESCAVKAQQKGTEKN